MRELAPANGAFNVGSFVQAIVKNVTVVVALKPKIDRILKSLG